MKKKTTKPKKIHCKIIFSINVPFYSYKTKKLNRKAAREIKRHIKEILHDECLFVPLIDEMLESSERTKVSIRNTYLDGKPL